VELRHLRYFVAVADELNFRRAAARLRISQPPLSQQIRRLEDELGAPLFLRTRRRVELTDAGRALLEHARPLIEQVERLPAIVTGAARGETGTLILGFVASSSYALLPTLLRAFRAERPGVEVRLRELSSARQLSALASRSIDVGLLRPPVLDETIATVHLLAEPLVVALPQDHPLTRKPAIRVRELSAEPFVLFPAALGGGFAELVLRLCAGAGFTPRVEQEADELQTIVNLVAAGVGVSLVPSALIELKRPGISYRPLAGGRLSLQLLVAHRADDDSALTSRFVSIARAVANGARG
jgi:LysR family transcriptional regulator, benzoate and cis,cis-muconate-responsive activator of ben and cat genes